MTYGLLYVIMLSRGEGYALNPKVASAGKENEMDEMANQAEELVKQVEEKMLYKFLDIIKGCESVDEVEEKIRALLNK